jgi:hypothetical protein
MRLAHHFAPTAANRHSDNDSPLDIRDGSPLHHPSRMIPSGVDANCLKQYGKIFAALLLDSHPLWLIEYVEKLILR